MDSLVLLLVRRVVGQLLLWTERWTLWCCCLLGGWWVSCCCWRRDGLHNGGAVLRCTKYTGLADYKVRIFCIFYCLFDFSLDICYWHRAHNIYYIVYGLWTWFKRFEKVPPSHFKDFSFNRNYGDFFVACGDEVTRRGMRILANPLPGDQAIVSGQWWHTTFRGTCSPLYHHVHNLPLWICTEYNDSFHTKMG